MRDILNTPVLFLIFVTLAVLGIAHLGHAAAVKWNNAAIAKFFSLTN